MIRPGRPRNEPTVSGGGPDVPPPVADDAPELRLVDRPEPLETAPAWVEDPGYLDDRQAELLQANEEYALREALADEETLNMWELWQ